MPVSQARRARRQVQAWPISERPSKGQRSNAHAHPHTTTHGSAILNVMVPDPVMDRLEASFERRRATMVNSYEGKWALMIYRRLAEPVQFFDTAHDAVNAGYRRAAGQRFLVKQVLKEDRVISITRLMTGGHS